MRPVLQNQPQIGNLGQFLLDALRHLVSSIQTGWNKQHDGDGAHTAVTAESLTVTPGVSVFSKLRLSFVDWRDDGVPGNHNNIRSTGIENVAWLRILPAQAGAADLDVTGIDAVDREMGDILLVTVIDSNGTGDVLFHLENAGSLAVNRFMGAAAGPAGPYRIESGGGVWLIRDVDYTGTGDLRHRWKIIGQF